MKERELRGLINKVKHGKLSRRGFISRMVMLG
jgi:peptide/nickel transport system substrate-binding protein